MPKLRDAYRKGQNEEELGGGGRIARAAHRAGSLSARSAQRHNEALAQAQQKMLDESIERAKGPNKTALEIVKAAAGIPHQTATDPSSSHTIHTPEGDFRQWSVSFEQGVTKDATRTHATPVAQPLGALKLDSSGWSHNGINTPADNVSITSTAPIVDGVLGAPVTRVYVNTRPYDPDFKDDSNFDREFGEQVSFELGPDGSAQKIAISVEGASGLRQLDVAHMQLGAQELLDGVLSSVQATATEYAQMGQDLEALK